MQRILVNGSHHCHTDKRGTRRLLVRNTCAWAQQSCLPAFDWLRATSLFPPRVLFTGCTLLWSCQNLIAAPTHQKPTFPQSERIINSVRNPKTVWRSLARACCWTSITCRRCRFCITSRPKSSLCKYHLHVGIQNLIPRTKKMRWWINLGKQACNHQSLALHEY